MDYKTLTDVSVLSEPQQVAALHRVLHIAGYQDGLGVGHISCRLDDGSILVTAREFGWD